MGGGMLALPLATGMSGFFPSIVVMGFAWLGMTLSALLLVEVNLWMGEGAHFISMSERFLGFWGKAVSWVLYLFVAYASLVAYTAEGSVQFAAVAKVVGGVVLSKGWACFLYAALFGGVIYLGNRVVGRVNTLLFCGMLGAYACLVIVGMPEVKMELLLRQNWPRASLALPLMLTAFSFQTMVPSLTPILNGNARALRWVIIGGTTVAFLFFLVWQYTVLGLIPLSGVQAAISDGVSVTHYFYDVVEVKWIATAAEFFSFFAIVTSFLAIALGLFDFLSDGLKIPEKGWGSALLGLMIVIPCWYFATYYEKIFLIALDTSGGFGDTILNGIIPVMMVWVGRYSMNLSSENRTPGGKVLLVVVALFFFGCLMIEILTQSGIIRSAYELDPAPIF